MVKILLLGNTGQLGWELDRSLQSIGDVAALDYPEIDMTSETSIRRTVQKYEPALIINATAYTQVDEAERKQELAMVINGTAPGVLAEEAKKMNAFLIHYSTDYVFDGKKGEAYEETDIPSPLNVYGMSKLKGELDIQTIDGMFLILRTAWVYSLRRENFVLKVLRWAKEKELLQVVIDQVSNPTWARSLAEITTLLLKRAGEDFQHWLGERKGIYHLAGDGYTSRYAWAKEILRLDPRKEEHTLRSITPARTAEFPSPAQRPLFSALDCGKFQSTFGFRLPEWNVSLERALNANTWHG